MNPENNVAHDRRLLVNTITTGLAAIFNMFVLLVLCFGAMPLMNRAIQETMNNQKAIEKNYDLLKMNQNMIEGNSVDLERRRKIIERLNKFLDGVENKKQ